MDLRITNERGRIGKTEKQDLLPWQSQSAKMNEEGFPSIRRSIRVSQLTPSRFTSSNVNRSKENEEQSIRPLRLNPLEPSSGVSSRSPRNSPRRNSAAAAHARIGEIFRVPPKDQNNQTPLRLDISANPHVHDSLIDSRTKQLRNLEVREPFAETPFKQFGEWPIDSLNTPLVNAQNRRVQQPQFSSTEVPFAMTQHIPEDTVKVIRHRKPEAATTLFRAKARSTQSWSCTMMISTFLIPYRK